MTKTALKEIVHRAVRDGSYRAQLQRDPAGALAGYGLTTEERSAIASGDPARLTALGVDQRMSKAFGAGILSDASKVIIAYEPGAGGAVVDETAQAVRSPMWRIEQDLYDANAARVDTEASDTAGATIQESEYAMEPATLDTQQAVRSPMWRLEQDLDAGDSLKAPEGGAVEITTDGNALTEY